VLGERLVKPVGELEEMNENNVDDDNKKRSSIFDAVDS
jgi:hypothetical protein